MQKKDQGASYLGIMAMGIFVIIGSQIIWNYLKYRNPVNDIQDLINR